MLHVLQLLEEFVPQTSYWDFAPWIPLGDFRERTANQLIIKCYTHEALLYSNFLTLTLVHWTPKLTKPAYGPWG